MIKTSQELDEFIQFAILADLFDQSDSDDIDLISDKIIDGLEKCKLINNDLFYNEDDIAA